MLEVAWAEVERAWRAAEAEARFAGRVNYVGSIRQAVGKWYSVDLSLSDLNDAYYLAYPEKGRDMEWATLSQETNRVADGATAFGLIRRGLRQPRTVEERRAVDGINHHVARIERCDDVGALVLLSRTGDAPRVIADGCHRATALSFLGRKPDLVYIGVSLAIAERWYFWPAQARRVPPP